MPFRPFLTALILLGLASSSPACRRRLENIYPDGLARNPHEATLMQISRDLEACLELGEGTVEARRVRLQEALQRWDRFYQAHPTKAPTKELDSPDYPKVMCSIQGYMRRIRTLTQASKWRERRVQSVAVQHIFGELYGILPGRAAPLDVVLYTLGTLHHLPAPDLAGTEEWRSRLLLLEQRLDRWVQAAPPILLRLTTLIRFRQVLGDLQRALTGQDFPLAQKLVEQLREIGPGLPGDASRIAWAPEEAGELLQPEVPEAQ